MRLARQTNQTTPKNALNPALWASLTIAFILLTSPIRPLKPAHAQTYPTSGTITSDNILQSNGVLEINAFGYNATIPADTSAKIRFSQDASTWYNSAGTQDAWDTLQNGDFTDELAAIDLTALNWSRNHFYYQIQIETTNTSETAVIDEINVFYTPGASVETAQPTYVTPTTATAKGEITVLEGGNATERGFEYGLTETATWSISESGTFTEEEFSLSLEELSPATTYYIRAHATNPSGTGYGLWEEFTTGEYVASGTITSDNLITGLGVAEIQSFGYNITVPADTSAKVQFSQDGTNWYSARGTPNGWTTLTDGDRSAEAQALDLSALDWSRNYFYYKMQFDTEDTTKSPILHDALVYYTEGPSVETYIPTDVEIRQIVAKGEITALAGGNATERGFEYGLTETATWSVSESGDFSEEEFSLTVTGLSPATTYYIRAYATNPEATGHGLWTEFTTGEYVASGTLTSGNLLEGQGVDTITGLGYTLSAKPEGSFATIQFSQDGSTWYSAAGVEGATTTMEEAITSSDGVGGTDTQPRVLDFCSLGWTGDNFYYKVEFGTGTSTESPVLDGVTVLTDDSSYACKTAGHWRFDRGYGTTAHDGSGYENDGTLSSATWTNNGRFGSALAFDSTDSATVAVTSIPADVSSICFWTKLDSATESILEFDDGGDGGSVAAIDSEIVVSGVNDYAVYVNGTAGVTLEGAVLGRGGDGTADGGGGVGTGGGATDWNHVCLTSTDVLISSSGTGFTFGKVGSTYLDGVVDEVKTFFSALSAEGAAEEYNAGGTLRMGSVGARVEDGYGVVGDDGFGVLSDGKLAEYCVPGSTEYCVGPVGEWLFDEGEGSVARDTSGNGKDGTLVGGPVWTAGKVGKALEFDGVGSYVDVGTSSSTVKTVAFWTNPTSTTETIIDLNGTAYIHASSGTITAEGFANETIYVNGIESSTISAEAWQHVAITTETTIDASDLDIGRIEGIGFFDGNLDAIKIYDYARTPAQIAWEYNKGAPIAHYRFDECSGTTANDSSPHANHATITIGASGLQDAVGTCETASTAWGNGATGKINASLNLDGTDDYAATSNLALVAANAQTYTDVSWGGWVRPLGGDSKTLMHKGNEFRLTTDGGGVAACEIYSGGGWQTGAVGADALSVGVWSHLLCTYDGENVRLYVGGVLADSQAESLEITSSSSTALSLGRDSAGTGYFYGQLDDMRVYNYALTATQARTLYNSDAAVRFE